MTRVRDRSNIPELGFGSEGATDGRARLYRGSVMFDESVDDSACGKLDGC